MPTLTLYPSLGTMALSGVLHVGQTETLAVVIAASESATFQSGHAYSLTIKHRGRTDETDPYFSGVLTVTADKAATVALNLNTTALFAALGARDGIPVQASVDDATGGPVAFAAKADALTLRGTAKRDGDVAAATVGHPITAEEVAVIAGGLDARITDLEDTPTGSLNIAALSADSTALVDADLAAIQHPADTAPKKYNLAQLWTWAKAKADLVYDAIGGSVPGPATAGEMTAGTETEVRLMSPAQIKLAVETFASSGSGGLAVVEVSASTLQPAYGRQYIASNDLELAAPATPEGTLLWESRIYLREGATLSYPAGWRVSGSASGTGANLAILSYLDGNWCLEWRAGFEMATGTRLYVSTAGNDSNDGYSWDQALRTPAAALTLAAAGAASEIWIATGTYNAGTLHGFEIPAGVMVYGGFQGLEQTLAERSHAAPEDGIGANTYTHETKLTNSRLVLASALQAVTGQQTYGTAIPTVSGCTLADSFVGAYTDSTNSFQCVDCRITGNQHVGSTAYNGGGTIGVQLQYCTVSGNTCDGGGAGIYQGTAYNCLIAGNTANPAANSGGGASSATLYSCRLTGNSAYDGGGAVNCTMYSCRCDGNTATRYGSGWYTGTAYNCESIRNGTGHDEVCNSTCYWCLIFGTGSIMGGYQSALRSCIVANCLYGQNNGTSLNCTALHLDNSQTYVFNSGTSRNNLAFGCSPMAWSGTQSNNLHAVLADFAAPLDLPDGLVGAANEEALLAAIRAHGYDLAAGATAIGQGGNSYVSEAYDYRGRTRIAGTVDCGAYEYQG